MSTGRPVFVPLQLGDLKLDRLQANLAAYLAQLDERVLALASPAVLVAVGDVVVVDQVLVDYRGTGGHIVLLPKASSAGKAKGRFVTVLNNGGGPIFVAAQGGDTIAGVRGLSLQDGDAMLASANGDTRWNTISTHPTVSSEWYSPVAAAQFFFNESSANVTANSGNFTTGDKFSSSRALVATGVRFFWKSVGSSKTVRAKIYGLSSAVGSVDVGVDASGTYEALFAAPVNLDAYRDYAATMYETTGTWFIRMDASTSGPFAAIPITGMVQTGPFTIGRSFQRSRAGDAVPDTTSTSHFFPVEPIFAPFSLE